MGSKVYYTDVTPDSIRNLLDKTRQLSEKAGLCDLKVYFGELGNIAYGPPLI